MDNQLKHRAFALNPKGNSAGYGLPSKEMISSLPRFTKPIAKTEIIVYKFDDNQEFADPSLLSYTNHELTDEQLANITNYFYK